MRRKWLHVWLYCDLAKKSQCHPLQSVANKKHNVIWFKMSKSVFAMLWTSHSFRAIADCFWIICVSLDHLGPCFWSFRTVFTHSESHRFFAFSDIVVVVIVVLVIVVLSSLTSSSPSSSPSPSFVLRFPIFCWPQTVLINFASSQISPQPPPSLPSDSDNDDDDNDDDHDDDILQPVLHCYAANLLWTFTTAVVIITPTE